MKIRNHHLYRVPGTDIEVELPIQPDSATEYKEPLVLIADDKIVLGYLAHDDDCANPLEDDDYAGHIYTAHRHGRTLSQYEEALALGDFSDGKPNPYAVLLDVYEHGQVAYSLSGAGMQCQFDTARGGAVWVPSEALIAEIEVHADAAERLARARECARQAAEQYTAWCNGDCYGTVVVTYDRDGVEVDHDSCWGYIGADDAYEILKQEFPTEVPA